MSSAALLTAGNGNGARKSLLPFLTGRSAPASRGATPPPDKALPAELRGPRCPSEADAGFCFLEMGRGSRGKAQRPDEWHSATDRRRWGAQVVVSVLTGRSAPASGDATPPPDKAFLAECTRLPKGLWKVRKC
ncbi:hypothetical protein NDU88_006639 [Pleurodeles waltl]|uniref:Uncharacterized protein n=1 Tax=Pleurodeles waltl TaxID=8319 RepID=A0AAV7MDL2_PLEWA|nr:hypothetical protein NDU88_006639 [Pleurodeles waltl]